jgi:cytochrome c5
MNIRSSIICTLFIASVIFGCKTTQNSTASDVKPTTSAVDCGSQIPSYESDIKPIFDKNCNHCHGERSAGGYDLRKIADITKAANKGELLGTIKWEAYYPHMPVKADKLDDATIKKIECWVQNGMK